jgi:hypothetical protein
LVDALVGMGLGLPVDKVVDRRDLIVAEVAPAEVSLDFFEVVDDISDVLVSQVFLGVLGQDFQVEIVEDLLITCLCPIIT